MQSDKECLRAILDALLDNEETRSRLIDVAKQDLLKALEPTNYLRDILEDMVESHNAFARFSAENLLKKDSSVKLPDEVRDKMLKAFNAQQHISAIWRRFREDMNKYGLVDDEDV